MRIHVASTSCDVMHFNGQGKLCPLTCAEWRNLSNYTRMRTIQSRTPEKKAENHDTLTWKLLWKSCCTTHLPFLSSHPNILKAFLKTFPTKMKPTQFPEQEKKGGKKSEKRGEEKKQKVKVKTAVSLLEPKTISKFCFSQMPELHKLIFCIWIRWQQSVRSLNGFV